MNFSNFLSPGPAGLRLLSAVDPNSCRHDCNLKCLIVQLSASTSCCTTSRVQKYPFTFKHPHSVNAVFFPPLLHFVLSSVCICFSLCLVPTPVRLGSCSVAPAASWSRAAPQRLSAAAWARSSIPGLVSHLHGCYAIQSFSPPALTEGRQGVPQVVGSSPPRPHASWPGESGAAELLARCA